MRPLLHPTLINGRSGDPALYIETLFEQRAILFDLGDIAPLSPRKVHRLDRVFVSHAHLDHFIGFDRLLRILVGREKTVALYGPSGFIDHVHHKLQAYLWNLADRYLSDLVFVVTAVPSQKRLCGGADRRRPDRRQRHLRSAGLPGLGCDLGTPHALLGFRH
jgi:ribonuclease Z